MKPWIKILITIFAVAALIFTIAYVFLVFKGRAMLAQGLSEFTHKKVAIGSLSLSPPLKLEIKDLNIEGLADIEHISFSPSLIGFIIGRKVLNEVVLVKPEFTYEKLTLGAGEGAAAIKFPSALKKLIVKRLTIKNGRLNFIDRSVGSEGIKITLKDINFTLNNSYLFPRSVVTNFDLTGRIPWQDGQVEGRIAFSGWINLLKRDMKAILTINDIDGIYLYPYYSSWFDLDKARIEKAKLNFRSNIEGVNNNLTAQCRLELTDIVRKPRQSEESADKIERIASEVFDIFRALNQGKIVLNFNIRTRMDRPEFGFSDIKAAVEDKVLQARSSSGIKTQDFIAFPAKFLEAMFKGASDISKGLFDGAVALGKEAQKTAEATFKR